jgi:uncharacterized protein
VWAAGVSDDTREFDGFEWDEAKSDATFVERGLEFDLAARVFDGDYVEREDRRQDYGERRYVVTGEVDGLLVTLVWSPRGRRRRIISAWPASNRERREYREHRATLE